MTTNATTDVQRRTPLTRERVVQTALGLADQGGFASLSMRRLGQELGVEAMALYHHFANKDEIVDGIIDLVFAEIDVPPGSGDWKAEMRQRGISLRDVLLRHRWAIGLMESRRNPGPANLGHHDAVLGSLRAGGMDIVLAGHAYSMLDSYIYGFALTKMNLPFGSSEEVAEVAEEMLRPFPVADYPHLVEMIGYALQPGYDFGDEFEYGLDAVIDGFERTVERGGP